MFLAIHNLANGGATLTKKEMLMVAGTVIVAVLCGRYIYAMDRQYDFAVGAFTPSLIGTISTIAVIHLWQITHGTLKPSSNTKLSNIITFILIAGTLMFCIYWLLETNFYSYPAILGTVAVVAGIIWELLRRVKKSTIDYTIKIWSIVFSSICIAASMVLFIYIQILQPVTLTAAEQKVSETYGENQFYYLDIIDNDFESLGKYYFIPRYSDLDFALGISVTTGEISKYE